MSDEFVIFIFLLRIDEKGREGEVKAKTRRDNAISAKKTATSYR